LEPRDEYETTWYQQINDDYERRLFQLSHLLIGCSLSGIGAALVHNAQEHCISKKRVVVVPFWKCPIDCGWSPFCTPQNVQCREYCSAEQLSHNVFKETPQMEAVVVTA
jgi:hypothetical protein